MRRRTGPVTTIQGGVPWNVAARVTVAVTAIPQISNSVQHSNTLGKTATSIAERLTAAFPVQVATSKNNSEFQVSRLPACPHLLRVTAEGFDGRKYVGEFVVTVADGETLSLDRVSLTELKPTGEAPLAADLTEVPLAAC